MTDTTFTRRKLIQAGAAMAAFASTAALAEDAKKAAMGGHAHHHAENPKHRAISKAALDCVDKGDVCLEHCFALLKTGDPELAVCADLVSETGAMCAALAKLASSNSAHLVAVAKVCIGICKACEDECRKHEKKHMQCKVCADACATCIKACKAITT